MYEFGHSSSYFPFRNTSYYSPGFDTTVYHNLSLFKTIKSDYSIITPKRTKQHYCYFFT